MPEYYLSSDVVGQQISSDNNVEMFVFLTVFKLLTFAYADSDAHTSRLLFLFIILILEKFFQYSKTISLNDHVKKIEGGVDSVVHRSLTVDELNIPNANVNNSGM